MLFRVILVVIFIVGLFALTSESMVISCNRSSKDTGICTVKSSNIFTSQEQMAFKIQDILSVSFIPINDIRGRLCNVAIVTKNGTYNLYKQDKTMKLHEGKVQKEIVKEFNTFLNDKSLSEFNKKEETNKLLLAIICIPISLFILFIRRKG